MTPDNDAAGTIDPRGQSVEALTRAIQGPRHAVELQSFRGIAALIVLLFHAGLYFDVTGPAASVFGVLFNAPAAVLSFFVLSGFVLAMSQRNRPLTIAEIGVFYTRRVFRIYPALWLGVALALVYHYAAICIGLSALVSDWWRDQIHADGLSAKWMAETLIGKATELTLPVWTLWIELLGSVMMPLIVFALVRMPALLALILAALVGFGLLADSMTALQMTGFVYGAGLLLVVPPLARRLTSNMAAWALAIVGLALLWFGRTLFGLIDDQPYGPIGILVSNLGASILIAVIYARRAAFPFLKGGVVVWLGDISYSVYLLHMPLLGFAGLTMAWLLGGLVGLPATLVLMAATIVLTGAVSTVSYRHVEVPPIALGKRLIAVLRRRD